VKECFEIVKPSESEYQAQNKVDGDLPEVPRE